MLDLDRFCNTVYQNLNFMVPKYINSEKNYACNDLSTHFRKIILRYIKIGHSINVIRQTACMVVNLFTVTDFAFLFGCTPAGRDSDSMMTPAERLLSKKKGKKKKKKSRDCHNHKPPPFPDIKRKRKQTKPNKRKSNKRTESTKISSLFPKRGNRNARRTEKHKNKITVGKTYKS